MRIFNSKSFKLLTKSIKNLSKLMKTKKKIQMLARSPLQLPKKNPKFLQRAKREKIPSTHPNLQRLKKKSYSNLLEERRRRMTVESSRMRMMRLLKLLGKPISKSSVIMATGPNSLASSRSSSLLCTLKLNTAMSLEAGPTKTKKISSNPTKDTHSGLCKSCFSIPCSTASDNIW